LAISAQGEVSDWEGLRRWYSEQAEAALNEHDRELALANRRTVVQECQANIDQIMRRAKDVDADLCRVLSMVEKGGLSSADADGLNEAQDIGDDAAGDLMTVPEPPNGGEGSAAQNAAWWQSLSEDEQQEVIRDHPEWIGNLDGVDFHARDQANRALIDDHRASLKQQQADLQRQLEEGHQQDNRPVPWSVMSVDVPGNEAALRKELAQVETKLQALDTVEQTLTKPDSHLLGLDFSQDRAQAIISLGDVQTADHVAVFTPGMTSTVEGITPNVQHMEDLRKEMDRQIDDAQQTGSTATVVWLDYQAPPLSAEALVSDNSGASSHTAKEAGHDLAEFYRGINSARSSDPDLTAIGHSYGSTTTGYAMREDTGVDHAIYAGSPGIGSTDLNESRVPTGESFYAEARKDPVGDLSRFGSDPTELEGMRHLDTRDAVAHDGRELLESVGHSEYMDKQTTSLYNMAAVSSGHPEYLIEGKVVGDKEGWIIW
jgi:hypothetical protein